jgi:hypothetical protein
VSAPQHLLHFTPGEEGFGTWRLECVHPITPHWNDNYVEPDVTPDPCHCLAAGNDCEDCRDGDHAACGYDSVYVDEMGPSCQLTKIEGGPCWVRPWWDETGAEAMTDEWPEDVMPLPVICTYDEGLIVRFDGKVEP